MEYTMEKIIALAKSRGFVYPGSEIYGGLANTWDYGNLGVELKNNVKRAWWQKFIQESPYNVGVDCAILMNPQTWVASGHLGSFSDPLMDCKECHERFRADKVIEEYMAANDIELEGSVDAWSKEEMKKYNVEKYKLRRSDSFFDRSLGNTSEISNPGLNGYLTSITFVGNDVLLPFTSNSSSNNIFSPLDSASISSKCLLKSDIVL